MARRAHRLDANQQEVVSALSGLYGVSVQSLAGCADGVPDLLVGVRGRNILIELKDGKKPPSARKLTKAQERWHASWTGEVHIIKSADEAVALIREYLERG